MPPSPWVDVDALLREAVRGYRSRVGADVVMTGRMTCAASGHDDWAHVAHLGGRFEGEVEGYDVVIVEPKGDVHGRVTSTTVVINGGLEGKVDAPRRVELQSKARFYGELTTMPDVLVIAPDAVFGRDADHTDPLA